MCALIFVLCAGASAFAAGSASDHRADLAATNGPHPCQTTAEHFITVDSLRVHYVETGAGATLVMIHGNAGNADDFTFGVISRLCSDYRIVAVDRAGHGKSDRPTSKTPTLEYQAQLLHETLADLGIKHPILLGHSWGAALALAYTLKYPSDVSGIVLLAPAAYPDKGADRLLRIAVTPPVIGDATLLVGKIVLGRHLLKAALSRAFYPEPIRDDYLKHATTSWLTRKHLKAYFEDEWSLNASLKRLSKHYSEIRVPVVIVTGDEDKIVSPQENAYRLRQTIPHSSLIEVKQAGHEIPLTHPQTVYDALKLISATSTRVAAR